jgi:hypothetical protein
MSWAYITSLNPGRSASGSDLMPAQAIGLNAADMASADAWGHSAERLQESSSTRKVIMHDCEAEHSLEFASQVVVQAANLLKCCYCCVHSPGEGMHSSLLRCAHLPTVPLAAQPLVPGDDGPMGRADVGWCCSVMAACPHPPLCCSIREHGLDALAPSPAGSVQAT